MSSVSLAPLEIREVSIQAVADGIERYLPAGVGVLVIGIPICLIATFAHFVLGISPPLTLGAGTSAQVAGQIIRSILQR